MIDYDFICISCNWSVKENENKIYCKKTGFSCNGWQTRPTHICEDFEEKFIEGANT